MPMEESKMLEMASKREELKKMEMTLCVVTFISWIFKCFLLLQIRDF